MNRTSRRHIRSGFTLMEMLAVITIIIILAGLVVGGMGYVNQRQSKEKAKVQISLLSNALEEYKLDKGQYPEERDGSNGLFQALYYDGVTNPGDKIYLGDLDPGPASKPGSKHGWTQGTGLTTTIVDPWGNEYNYRRGDNNAAMNPDFDLWSNGPDGQSSSAANKVDDITNY